MVVQTKRNPKEMELHFNIKMWRGGGKHPALIKDHIYNPRIFNSIMHFIY